MTIKLTQKQRILEALEAKGSVTNIELNNLGIYRYSARIKDLRDAGHLIEAVHVRDGLWKFVYGGQPHETTAAAEPKELHAVSWLKDD